MPKPLSNASQSAVLGRSDGAGPGRAQPGSQDPGRAAGLRRARSRAPRPRRAGGFPWQPAPSSRSHAWTGPCSPLILGSRVGRTRGMLPMDLPIEGSGPENFTPLCRCRWVPVSAAENRDRDQEQEKALPPGFLSPTREQRAGRVALVFLFSTLIQGLVPTRSRGSATCALPSPAPPRFRVVCSSRGCRTGGSNAMSLTQDCHSARLYTRSPDPHPSAPDLSNIPRGGSGRKSRSCVRARWAARDRECVRPGRAEPGRAKAGPSWERARPPLPPPVPPALPPRSRPLRGSAGAAGAHPRAGSAPCRPPAPHPGGIRPLPSSPVPSESTRSIKAA
ncbi:serine/arginine repetitive matrix protein 1-like [Passer domesticus]|uniref:serine/arginine repetitive matrix protein 1-like n=1 Tax=Passer domesticus TaxID=48849 RepID=UPI0030FEF3B6